MERMTFLFTLLAIVVGIQGLNFTNVGASPPLSGVINQKFDSSIKPVMSQHLMTSFQHMITQAFNDLENRIEDKLSQFQSDLNDKVNSIQINTERILQQNQNVDVILNAQRSSLENIEDKVNVQALALENIKDTVNVHTLKLETIADTVNAMTSKLENIEDEENIESGSLENIKEKLNNQQDNLLVLSKSFEAFEKNMDKTVDKISQVDIKLSVIDSQAIQNKVMKTIQTQIDEQFSKLINATQVTEDTVSKTSSQLTFLHTQSVNFQNDIKESYQQMFSNVTREMDTLFHRDKNLTNSLQSNFLSLKNDVAMSWQNLQSSANKSTVEATKALQEATSDLNLTLTTNIESALIHFFQPKACQKNLQVSHLTPVYLGVYKTPFPGLNVPVLCDTTTSGGGWIIIQRRSTREVEFYRDWASYKEGFGSLDTEFWLGNDNIHKITASGDFELRVDLKYEWKSYYAAYSKFSVSGEDSGYTLTVEGYSGTAGDSLGYHNGKKFSTYNKDNDEDGGNCAVNYTGAWWYKSCYKSNLNGIWGGTNYKTLAWNTLTSGESVTFSEMKIRQK